MTDLQKLREPFPPEQVGKLPRVWCKACKEAGRGRTCSEHQITKCRECGQKGTTGHLHLDFVGHAEVTDRLLSVDPEWTWEPMGFTAEGTPAVAKEGNELNLWIRLTVGGVTKPGVGIVTAGTSDAHKQLVSDALRNAAMRFGVALDLWAKTELDHTISSGGAAPEDSGDGSPHPPVPAPSSAGSESKGKSAPPRGATRNKADNKGEEDVPGDSRDVGEIESDPGGESVSPPDLSPRLQIQQRINSLTDSQKLILKTLWVENRLVPFKDAELEPPYVAKVEALLAEAEAA